jgi:hypothetical protein
LKRAHVVGAGLTWECWDCDNFPFEWRLQGFTTLWDFTMLDATWSVEYAKASGAFWAWNWLLNTYVKRREER